uniref:Uncharacterized protein n=1 Tax=Magallana gigas TaxID=29159 RepID=K1QZP7_MAGGI
MKNLFFNPQPTSDTLNVTVETQSKRCQATIPVPQRTRRIQVNCPPVVTVSIGTQCSSLTDNVPLRVAAGLVPLPQQPDPLPLASDDEEDDQPGHQDPNYDPMEDSDESSEGEEDVVTTYPLTGMPSQKTRGSSLSRRPVWHSFCRDYVEELRINLVERRRQFTSCPSAAAEADAIIGYKPPPLTSSYVPINKEELVAMRWSMFAI